MLNLDNMPKGAKIDGIFDLIEKAIKQKGETIQKVCVDIGVVPSNYRFWKNHQHLPKLETVKKMFSYFGPDFEAEVRERIENGKAGLFTGNGKKMEIASKRKPENKQPSAPAINKNEWEMISSFVEYLESTNDISDIAGYMRKYGYDSCMNTYKQEIEESKYLVGEIVKIIGLDNRAIVIANNKRSLSCLIGSEIKMIDKALVRHTGKNYEDVCNVI